MAENLSSRDGFADQDEAEKERPPQATDAAPNTIDCLFHVVSITSPAPSQQSSVTTIPVQHASPHQQQQQQQDDVVGHQRRRPNPLGTEGMNFSVGTRSSGSATLHDANSTSTSAAFTSGTVSFSALHGRGGNGGLRDFSLGSATPTTTTSTPGADVSLQLLHHHHHHHHHHPAPLRANAASTAVPFEMAPPFRHGESASLASAPNSLSTALEDIEKATPPAPK